MGASSIGPGTVIGGRYQVDARLGEGGMGVVFLGHHLQLGNKVAIKLLLPELARHPQASERFLREARAAISLHSENAIRILDLDKLEGGEPFIVMEFLEGADLASLLASKGPMPVWMVADYLLQATEALAEAHSRGMVHRDLKPANVFLTRRADGSALIKVLDFGIAKIHEKDDTSPSLTATAAVLGSPMYMAPEQVRSARRVDARADVWSLGVMLQELVSGTAPFRAETLSALLAAVVADAPIPLRAVMPTAPPGLEELILRCLQKNPDHRFENVAAFAAALAPYASPGGQRAVERVSSLLSGGVVSARAAGPALAPTLDPYAAVQSAMTPIPSPVPSPPASGGGLSPAPHFAQPLPVAAYSQDGLAASRGGRPALPPSNAGMFVGIGSAAVVVILVVIGVAYVGIQAHKRSIAANDPTASTTQPAAPPPPAPSATTTPASMLAPITSTPLPSATTHPSAHPTSTTTATATGGGGSTFDESGARAMLRSAATGAANCGDSDGPSGSGVARVTFSTSGNVANVYVSPPFSGTAVGACVSRKLVGVVVDPFTGPPHAVNVQFNVP